VTFKSFKLFLEKVSNDCQTGAGIVPNVGPFKNFKIIRTNHLDDKRGLSSKERDADFDCESFDLILKKFFQKRPLGVQDGKYSLFWENKNGVQSMIIEIDNKAKALRIVTIMQLNKNNMNDYKIKHKTIKINLGKIEEP
jgi:hypothetical protein